MASKRRNRRSRSLSDILKVCIPHIENIRKNQEKSETTDCNKEKAVLLEIRDLKDKNDPTSSINKTKTAWTFRSSEESKVLQTASQDGQYKSKGKPKVKSSRKSYRRERRATLADLTCVDILKPIPEMEDEETESSVIILGNWTVQRQFGEEHSKINRNKIELQLDYVDHEDRSGQRHLRNEILDDLKKWKDDWENVQCTKNISNNSHKLSLNGPRDESFGQRREPLNKESDTNKDPKVEEQNALNDSLSEENDEDSESKELKLAVSNYEIAYDVDEDENANIFERLQEIHTKSRQRSDSLSSLASNGSGSDGSMSSVSPVDEKLLRENMQTAEVPRRRRRFSTSDLHLRCLLHALPLIREEDKKNSLSSSASSDSNESIPIDLMRRRSGSLPNILQFKQVATMNNQRYESKPKETKEKIGAEDDRSNKQQSKNEHCEATSPGNPKLSQKEIASKALKRRNSMSVLEGARTIILDDPVATQNGELAPEVPLSIGKNFSLENGGTAGFCKKSLESKSLIKALGQKMRASIRRRNSIASLKPWTGIVESSLKSSFPIPTGEEGKNEDNIQTLPRKNAIEDRQLLLSIDRKNREKDNVNIVQRDLTSGIGSCISSELKSQKNTKSAFIQVNKRHGVDKENDLETVQRTIDDVKNNRQMINESLIRGEARSEPSLKTFFMPMGHVQPEEHSPHLITSDKSQSKVSTVFRSRNCPIKETPASKPDKGVKSLSRKNNTVRQEPPRLSEKIRKVPIGRTSSNPLPKGSSLNRPENTGNDKRMKQNSLSMRQTKGSFDIKERPARTSSNPNRRPPSPSPVVSKQEGMKMPSLKTEKGKVDAKSTSNRSPSPSTVSKTNTDKKQNISTSKTGNVTHTKKSVNRPPSPSRITKAHQGTKHEISNTISKNGKGTPTKRASSRPPSPSTFTKTNQRTRPGSFSTYSEKTIDGGTFSDKTVSKSSQSAFAQTEKRNTNSPQLTRKAGASSTLSEENKVPPNVSNEPNGHVAKDSVTAKMEEKDKPDIVRDLEGIAAEIDKANKNDARNVHSEEVPHEQETNKEEKPTERLDREDVHHKFKKLDGVTIAKVSKIIPEDRDEKARESKTSVNVIRRPLSASLCITVPVIPSAEYQNQDRNPTHLLPNTSIGKSSSVNKICQRRSNIQVKGEQNLEEGFEKELDSFGSLLEEFEKSPPPPPLHTNSSNVDLTTSESDNGANQISNEAIPTEKRFAALSERYNAIMAKFGMLNKTSLTERTIAVEPTRASALPVTMPAPESEVSRRLEISSPPSADNTKARDSTLPNAENRVTKVGYSSPLTGTDHGGKVGKTPVVPKYNFEVGLKEVPDTVSSNEHGSAVVIEELPDRAKLTQSKNKATLQVSEDNIKSLTRPAQHTTGSVTSEDTIDDNGLCRTTVIARLMDRKLCPRRKTSIVPILALRKSKLFDGSEAGIKEIPLTIEHFNRYRDYIEKVTLKSAVRTEAMSIHEILNSLGSSLMEMELIALCKECTKTLRTLDALGSLPSYLSPNTVIVNPSGTVKFRHLNTDVTIDELLLAPEHSKKFSSEKSCVFSLAVTIWLAADWKLTEHNKPALSRKFQELLISMTKDSSKERASLDSILQTCESLHSDNEMTSRERCQALLWECQATKDLHKQNVDKKAIEESEKTKAQHAILMGSVCVAANVKGFLKQSRSPAEAKNVQDTNSGEIQNKSLEKEPERKSTIEQEIDYNKGKQPNARDPSPAAGSLFSHYRNLTDTSMMFSPISGNPKPNHQSSFPGGQSQTSTPTFVPIAVPVPTAGPPPMWYMTPSGMVPFGPMGHHPGYFVPVNQGSGSYVVSDEVTSKDIERNSRPSTPKSETSQGSSVSKTTRDVTASTKSKIPRPIRDPNRRSPRPPNSHQRRDEPRSIPTTRPSEEPQVRGSKNDETYTSPKTESSPSSHEPGGTTTSLYRSHTPPVRLRSGSVELERQNLRRPRPRSSTGSLVSAPSSGERVSRPSSPVTHSKRNEKSRPSSPCFSEGRSGSRPSSPLSSRSSSPVAALISRFEDLSTEKQASEYSQSVSNLLSKFGSSSLLPEDRLTKKHFKTNVPQTREHNYYGRSGPFRPTSAADHLSNKWHSETNESLSKSWQAKPTQRQPNQSDASSLNRDDSPLSRNLPNKAETIGKTRNRSASSLENLHGVPYWEDKRQSTEQYSMRKNRERSWSSMENLHKASYEEQVKGYRIKKFSSAENLSQGSTEVDVGSKDHGVSSITSQGLRKSLTENSYNDFSYASGKGMAKNEPKLVRPLPLERTSAHSQELNVGIRETAGGSILKSTVMKAERDYQQDYTKEAVSSSTRSRFEIPVALAVMDSERESMGSSAFIPSLFSPSSAVKDKVFFQYPIKLEKESAPLSPPIPLSPSLKDCRPTSYFSSLSFTDLAMNPEKDTSNDGNKKSDAGHPPRATSYQVNSDSVPIGHQDKPDMIELVGTNSNVKKLNFNKDREKGKSSRNSSLNAHDYLERFQKRLTKTNSLENIRQDMEELISSLSRNNSKPKNFEGNAPSKSHLVMKESLGKLPNDSSGNSLEKAKKVHQEKGTLGSLVSQNLRASRNFQTETQSKQINKERSPSETGAQGKSASNKTQQTSKSGIEYSSAPCKLPSVTNPQGTEPPKPLPNKPSSVPNTPISGNSKYSNFFSYARRQSSPNIGSSAEKLHSRRSLLDIHNEKSGEHDDSSSSNHHERKIKESSKPKSPAPSTNHQATGRHQPSITAEQSAFDFPEKIFMEKGAGGAFANKQLNRNIRHKEVVKTQSNPLSVEHILSNETQITDARTDSSDLTSSKLENTRPLILRSPTSPTSSSNSNSSSPSPRLPLNKSMFYFPSSERAEKQLSPTEHLDSSGQKGFVITDTSRQRSKNTDSSDYRVPHKASSSDTEMEEQTMKTLEKSSLEHPSGLAAELHEIKYLKSGDKSLTSKKVTEPANTADNINIVLEKKEFAGSGEPSSITAQPNKYNHSNMNLEHRDKTKQEQGIEKKSEKSLHRTLHYSGSSEEVKQSPTSKERNTTSVGEGEVSGGRRRSIDLRQIYNSAQRASLTPRLDTTSPKSSSSHSTTSRPNSALDKRPPSPNRLDSKELLGHFVKKVLNSANTTKSSNSSPSSSFAEGTCTQSSESSKTDILGIYVLSPREREKSSENRNKERKESLERKQEGETKEIKMNPKGNQQLERKASNEMEQRHDDQARTDAARERKERNVSHQRVEQYGDQGKIDATKDRKGSHERKEQHGDQKRINATRERKASHEKERHHDNQDTNDSARGRKNPYERKQKYEGLERIDAKIDIMTSDKTEYQAERGEAVELKRRLSHETDKQPLPHRIEEIPLLALNKEALQTQQESLDTPRETDDVLNKLVDMIHDEFAFDGYLDDGVEDVNMGEYVMSLTGMSEDMFKESVRDQYSDLYWDGDLLQDMYILVNKKLTSRKPTLRFSESIASDVSRPGSSQSMESNPETSQLATRSVSRTSSERSFHETRDYLMSSLGEPTQFLPFKMICPEITRDIIDELGPVFEDYQKEMKIKLAPSISELMEKLGAKILEIGQQLTLERRAKKKNIASFNKVADIDHKKDVKDLVSKLLQEIEESDKKIIYLKYIQRRLRNIYAERFGLDHSLLYSFVNSYSITNVSLEPKRQNNLLIFSPLWDQRSNQSSEAHGESTRGPVLQYGTTQGMLSYLFARHSMSQAFVRFFLYTFRYCATPDELFLFILDKCRASLRAETGSDKTYNHQLQIRYRGLDLLAEWTNCCFQFDFKTDPRLLQSLFAFLQQELIPVDKTDRGKMLVELITEKQRKDMEEHVEETSDTLAVLQTEDSQGSILEKDSPRKFPIKRKKSPVQCFKRGSPQASSMYKATVYLKAMSVIDHSSRTIAEQLTLIQQDVFARVHSIHFLNSRTLGIGVGRLSPTKETSQLDSMLGFSAGRRRSITSDTLNQSDSSSSPSPRTSGESNLFICQPVVDGCLEALLMHAQDVSMWVAVEICSAPSIKNQLVLIQKYISIAKYCAEMRNFATSVQIVDALEMFVIRQLPVWKQVPNKVIQTLEELKAIKVLLKTDSSWLLKNNAYREKPTIPCALLFLMHIQQLELGGFTLANGMYKWTKMRSIARLVDQIRLFKQMRYAFESSDALKDRLRMRIQECREENLHALAAENAANFHLSSSQSSRKFQEAFKKMKATFGNG